MNALVCIVDTETKAAAIVAELKKSGFRSGDISTLFSERAETSPRPTTTDVAASPVTLAAAGALGWLPGMGTVGLPGFGPLVGAGPIVGVLGGATVDGIARAINQMGVSKQIAERYQDLVREGNILISVHTDNPDEIKRAREIFHRGGAELIAPAEENAEGGRDPESKSGLKD